MSKTSFYPYRTAPGRLRLDLRPVSGTFEHGSDGSLLIYATDGPDPVRLGASVAMPDQLIADVLAPEDQTAPPVRVDLVYRSIESRCRGAHPLTGDGIVYDGELVLQRDSWAGSVEFQAVLTRTVGGHGLTAGYAADAGARLAWSDSVKVLFDAPAQTPGDRIETRWVSFHGYPDPWIRTHQSNLFALEMSGARPLILLNRDIDRAYTILHNAGTHGRKARIRDATNFMIAHQVWSSLLAVALSELGPVAAENDESPGIEEILRDVGEWQQRVIHDWSTYLYPDYDAASALERLVGRAREGQLDEIMGRLPNAIQERFRTFLGFEGLSKEFDRL